MTVDAPEGLESTFALMRAAYPDGLPDEDYLPLLRVLSEHMSERALGQAIALLFDRERIVVQNDAAATWSWRGLSAADVERVVQHLRKYGFDKWKAEE